MNKITADPHILGGKPIIRGTRISVELILSLVASGLTINDIIEEYPHLKKSDIKAAIDYGALLVGGSRTSAIKNAASSTKK